MRLLLLLLYLLHNSCGLQSLGFVELDDAAISVVRPAAERRAAHGGGIIIPLFSNRGFMPFLRNLICSMQRLRVDAWLVIAMDNSTCPALMGTSSDNDGSACVFPYHSSKTSVITGGGGVATYRSQDFNRTC